MKKVVPSVVVASHRFIHFATHCRHQGSKKTSNQGGPGRNAITFF